MNGNDYADFIDSSIEEIKECAEKGCRGAQEKLAVAYDGGDDEYGIVQDDKIAFRWFKLAAKQGARYSQFRLGDFYRLGIGVKQNLKKALCWYEKAAEQGNVKSQCIIGYFYSKGIGCEQDFKKSFYWYKKAADRNDANAQYNLAVHYANGEGVPKNYKKAFEWYKKAAVQNYVKAQSRLGIYYEFGYGVEKDYERAAFWFSKAIDNGDLVADLELRLCEHHIGFSNTGWKTVDGDELMEQEIYMEKRRVEEYIKTKNGAKLFIYAGLIKEKDENAAVKYYKMAADFGDSNAQFVLGNFYFNGNMVEQNYKKAITWYEKAAEQGNAYSQFMLGQIYFYGKGVKKNSVKAAELFTKAAENGGYSFYRNYPGITWQEKLKQRIKFSGETGNKICKKAHISKQTYEKIINGKTNAIKKETVLALSIGLKYDIEEAKEFLAEMGYAFSKINPTDKIVQNFILKKNYNIDDINKELYKNNLPLLGDERNS